MAARAVVAGERLRRHCPGRELASTARLPAPVSRGVRAAGAGRPEVPARPGPASCPRAGRAAPGRDYSGAFWANRRGRPSRHQQPSRGPLTRAPACLLPGSGVLRPTSRLSVVTPGSSTGPDQVSPKGTTATRLAGLREGSAAAGGPGTGLRAGVWVEVARLVRHPAQPASYRRAGQIDWLPGLRRLLIIVG